MSRLFHLLYIANRLALLILVHRHAFLLVRMDRCNSLEKRVALTHTLLSKIETAARAAASTGGFHTGVDDTFS